MPKADTFFLVFCEEKKKYEFKSTASAVINHYYKYFNTLKISEKLLNKLDKREKKPTKIQLRQINGSTHREK